MGLVLDVQWHQHIADLLAWAATHSSPCSLNDVNPAVSRGHKGDHINARHVHSLGQATSVRHYAVRTRSEVVHQAFPQRSWHSAVDMEGSEVRQVGPYAFVPIRTEGFSSIHRAVKSKNLFSTIFGNGVPQRELIRNLTGAHGVAIDKYFATIEQFACYLLGSDHRDNDFVVANGSASSSLGKS